MKFYIAVLSLSLFNAVFSQGNRLRVFPEFGYAYQKVHVVNAGVHFGIPVMDSTGFLTDFYSLTFNAELTKHNGVSYLMPNVGIRGYNGLSDQHFGICYGINVSNYHALGYKDWLITPEIGWMWCGLNVMIGYGINLDKRHLDFYIPLKLSLRLTI